jgi:hypothetical protein
MRLEYLNQEIGKKEEVLAKLTNAVQQNYPSEEEEEEEEEEKEEKLHQQMDDGVMPFSDHEFDDDNHGPGGMAAGIVPDHVGQH